MDSGDIEAKRIDVRKYGGFVKVAKEQSGTDGEGCRLGVSRHLAEADEPGGTDGNPLSNEIALQFIRRSW